MEISILAVDTLAIVAWEKHVMIEKVTDIVADTMEAHYSYA